MKENILVEAHFLARGCRLLPKGVREFWNFDGILDFFLIFQNFSGSYGDSCRNFCIEFRGVREFFEPSTPRFKVVCVIFLSM